MYKKKDRNHFCPVIDDVHVPFESSEPYHSLGYYVLGGLDVTGEHLKLDASVTYDSEDDISSGCGVDSLSDPRVGFFDVAEELGVRGAEALAEEVANNSK